MSIGNWFQVKGAKYINDLSPNVFALLKGTSKSYVFLAALRSCLLTDTFLSKYFKYSGAWP